MKKILLPFVLLVLMCYTLNGQTTFDQSATLKSAQAFLASLNPAQKTVANLVLADSSRFKWSNLPLEQVYRQGLQFKDMADSQRLIIHHLLRTVLSQQGYQKFAFIIEYDQGILDRLSKANSPIAKRYGNQNYWFTIFGTPDKNQTWAWKFEGHHISLNFTHSPKGVTCTPMFVGINPALTTSGPYAGTYLMADENELGNQLFNDLSPALQTKALLGPHPSNADPLTQTGKEPHMKDKRGVSFTEMNAKQQLLVERIIKSWVENLTPALAQEKFQKVWANKNKLIFNWMGTKNTKELHYYSIKSDKFIIEFTNRDGAIYHYHTLWRDLEEDFKNK